MDPARRSSVLDQLEDLDRRDRSVAQMLEELAALTDEVQALRSEATGTAAELERPPGERAAAESERAAAAVAAAETARASALARAVVAELEGSRKSREDELERARRELQQAITDERDAAARSDRAQG